MLISNVKILDNFSGAMSSLVHLTLETSFLVCFVHFRAEKTDPLHENVIFPRQSAYIFLRNAREMDLRKNQYIKKSSTSWPPRRSCPHLPIFRIIHPYTNIN